MFTVAGKGLEVAGKGIAGLVKGTPYPVQASAIVSTCADGLTVSGSTYGTWAQYKIDADYPVPGDCNIVHVDGAGLAGIVRGLKGAVPVEVVDGRVSIGHGGIDFNGIPVEDYPLWPVLTVDAGILSLSGKEFKKMVKGWGQVAQKSGQTTRLSLTGVNVVATETGTEFTLTNGYTLLHETIGDTVPAGAGLRGLFPVDDIKKSAAGIVAGSIVSLSLTTETGTGNRYLVVDVSASWGRARYSIRSIDEEFPDYRRVIPTSDKVRFTIDPSELGPLAASAYRAAPDETRHCTLTLDQPGQPDTARLTISASRPGVDFTNSIPVGGCVGAVDFVPTYVNAKFLEQLAGFTDGPVELYWSAPLNAIRADYRTNWSTCHFVIMPTNPGK